MKFICADDIMLNTKGPNQSLGNHILHLFGCFAIAKKLGIGLYVGCVSNLDELFNLEKFNAPVPPPPVLLYHEKHGGSIEDHVRNEVENNDFFVNLLSGNIEIPDSFYIKGWLWNSLFLPDPDIFDHLIIRDDLQEKSDIKSTELNLESSLVIHYRGTDFSNHSIGWGDVRLREEYYIKCLEDFFMERKACDIIIVSDDDTDFLYDICKKYSSEVKIEKNNYLIDWLILLKSKKLICSNSSFCYTAGWKDKEVVYQPSKFMTRYIDTDLHYPVYPYYTKYKSKLL